MKILFCGDSLTEGIPGESFLDILWERMPEHELVNFGYGGDTVESLLWRVEGLDTSKRYDAAFIWVGANDIYVKVSWLYPAAKTLKGQPWAKDNSEFEKQYRKNLDILLEMTDRVVAISPLMIGEDPHSDFNREMGELAELVYRLTAEYEGVDYLDLRDRLFPLLEEANAGGSGYPREKARDIIRDAISSTPEDSEELSAERELLFTIDGVHFNRRGAELVADVVGEKIKEMSSDL